MSHDIEAQNPSKPNTQGKTKPNKLLNILLRPFKEHLLFLIVFFVLASSIHIIRFIKSGPFYYNHAFHLLLHSIALSYFVTLLVGLIRHKLTRRIIQGIILFVSAVFFISNTYCLFELGSLLQADFAMLAIGTNPNEVSEFLKSMVSPRLVYSTIAILALIIILWVLSVRHPIRLGKKLSLVALGLVCICTIDNLFRWNIWEDGAIGHLTELITSMRNNELPDISQVNHTPPKLTFSQQEHIPENLVLILGESFARFHSSLYGYDKMTNPYLTALRDSSMLYTLDSISSPAPTTSLSLQSMMTTSDRAVADSKTQKWYEFPTLIDILKECGYHCYWFSNHTRAGKFSYVARILAESCDTCFFFRKRDNVVNYIVLDIVLVDSSYHFIKKLNLQETRNFTLFHVMGSHFDYSLRYPKEFNHFSKKDYMAYPENQREILAAYDNSILYNDYIVKRIIDIYKDKEALILYVPDHGQDLYRSSPTYFTHGKINVPESRAYGEEIPFMIYATPSYRKKNPEIFKRIAERQDHPKSWNTENLPYFIMELIGIEDMDGESVHAKSPL